MRGEHPGVLGIKDRDWLWAGLIVALVQVGCALLLWPLPERISFLHNVLMFPLVFPGGILVVFFHLQNMHDVARWEIVPSLLISWLFYTWLFHSILVRLRHSSAARSKS